MAEKKRFNPKGKEMQKKVLDLVITLLAVLLIRYCVVAAHMIPSQSMEDTLLAGDFLLSTRLVYGLTIPYTGVRIPGFKKPRSGDIVIFRAPHSPKVDYIKRCVAHAGQTLEIRDKVLYLDGQELKLPRKGKFLETRVVPREIAPRDNFGPFRVPMAGDTVTFYDRGNSLNLPYDFIASIIYQEHNPVNNDPFIIVKDALVSAGLARGVKKVEVLKRVFVDSSMVQEIRRPVHHPDLSSLEQRVIFTKFKQPDQDIYMETEIYLDGKRLSGYRIRRDNYFMMGDNRDNSLDSRYWGFVNETYVVSSPFIIFWSWKPDRLNTTAVSNPLYNLKNLVVTLLTNIHNAGIITKPRWTRIFRLI